jgi:WD40 repeat protein
MATVFFIHLIQAVLAARDSLRITIQLLQALEIELDKKLNYLLALYNYMQGMEACVKKRIDATASVKLNMRGTVFVVDTKYLDNIFFHILIFSDPAPIRGHYFIDRPFEGFDRIVNAIRGEVLSFEGLNDYEVQYIDANLEYFRLPYPKFKRIFNKSKRRIELNADESITKVFVLQDGHLCAGFISGVIKIFNTSTFQCVMELREHVHIIGFLFQLFDGRLCSASRDTIKLWNLSSGECETFIIALPVLAMPLVQYYSSTQIVCYGFRLGVH